MSMTSRQLHRAMSSLRPGDVLTDLACGGCRDRKILVLARAGEGRYEFSERADEINIVRDQKGPWRWVEHRLHFENDRGEIHDHIGAEVRLLEGAGLMQLQWYRELPAPEQARFHIDPKNALAHFTDPAMEAKLVALLNREAEGNNAEFARNLQQAIDLIFGGATHAVDERRMRHLVVLAHAVGQKLARSSRGPSIADILGAFVGGQGPSEEDFARALFGGMDPLRRPRRERRDPHRGNGHDHSAERGHAGFPG